MKDKRTTYKPAAAAFLTMMAMALTSSTMSFFLEPICGALGIGRGSFSFVFSLMSVTGALVSPFLGAYMGRHGVRRILLAGGFSTGCCMMLLSQVESLGMLYGLAAVMGLMSSTPVALCANVMVQQSYSGPQASSILGVVMAGSGVGGMIFNLLIPGSMDALGWKGGAVVMGICWLAALWLAALVLGKEERNGDASGKGGGTAGMTRAEAVKDQRLYLMIAVIVILCACCGVQQQLPAVLGAHGLDGKTVSVMLSASTGFLAVGKILQGLLYGRIGVGKGGSILLMAFAAGNVLLLHSGAVWPGVLLLSLGFGIYTTLLPQVTRQIFGSREYAAIWSLVAMAGNGGTFLANPLWGAVYDFTGSYALGLIGCAVLLLAAMWAMLRALKKT